MADQVGQQFGIYQLTSVLAESPFAEVYRGEQRYSHIEIAVKLLRRPLATAGEVDAFRGEARALAALVHPHIVRLLSFDVQEQIGYLVMDYAPGGTLRQRHPGGAIVPLETILSYAKQIADALQYAHEQGVVHQALMPESLLIGHQDEIVLAGFYLASAHQATDQQAPEQAIAVTSYLAPEQLQGKPESASDQYALAAIVYEWLSGSQPFQGSGAELAQQILTAAPPPLHTGVPAMASAAERVVMRALAKDPAKRFASVQAFAAALEEAAQAEPAPQPAAASAAPAKQPVTAGHAATAQPARGPARPAQPGPAQPQPTWQGQRPTQAPAPVQQPGARPPIPYQMPAQPPAWQRPPVRTRSSNMNTVGCVIAIILVALIGFIIILSSH
jgi:serine/threonine protein kinase